MGYQLRYHLATRTLNTHRNVNRRGHRGSVKPGVLYIAASRLTIGSQLSGKGIYAFIIYDTYGLPTDSLVVYLEQISDVPPGLHLILTHLGLRYISDRMLPDLIEVTDEL